MKEYQELQDGSLTTDNMTIPPTHGLYRIAQEEVAKQARQLSYRLIT